MGRSGLMWKRSVTTKYTASLANGSVVGLLAPDNRDTDDLGRDPFAPPATALMVDDAAGDEPEPEPSAAPATD